jgi:hypothetical protein
MFGAGSERKTSSLEYIKTSPVLPSFLLPFISNCCCSLKAHTFSAVLETSRTGNTVSEMYKDLSDAFLLSSSSRHALLLLSQNRSWPPPCVEMAEFPKIILMTPKWSEAIGLLPKSRRRLWHVWVEACCSNVTSRSGM